MKTFLLSIFLLPVRFHWFARLYPHLCNPSRMKSSKYYITLFSCVPFVLSSVVKSFSWQKKEKRICVLLRRVRAHVSIYSDLLKFAVCACVFSLCDFSKCTLNSICAHSFLNLVDRMIVNFLINICPHWHICQAYGLWCACVQKRKIWHSI